MAREIKFRAFDKSDGRMLVVAEPQEQGKREYYPFEVQVGFSHFDKNDIILMQWTGLQDKNFNDVYEGDIVRFVKWNKQSGGNLEIVGEVKWNNQGGGMWITNGKYYTILQDLVTFGGETFVMERLEIIGNIYENPELLKP